MPGLRRVAACCGFFPTACRWRNVVTLLTLMLQRGTTFPPGVAPVLGMAPIVPYNHALDVVEIYSTTGLLPYSTFIQLVVGLVDDIVE